MKKKPPEPKLIGIDEIVGMLGICRSSFLRLRKDADFPEMVIKNPKRWRRKDITAHFGI